MAARKATKKRAGGARKRAVSENRSKAVGGRAPRSREWNPAQPETRAAALPEVNEPRPYISRYPIPNSQGSRAQG